MGVAKIACLSQSSLSSSEKQDFSDKKATHQLHFIIGGEDSMSQEYHHHQQPHEQPQASIFNFPNGFDRSAAQTGEDPGDQGLHPVYESAGMLSEMFNFGQGPGPGPNATAPPELLDYRRAVGGLGPEWYGSSNRQVGHEAQRQGVIGDHQHQHEHNDTPTHHQHQMGGGINAHNSAAAMQLFQTNPPQRSPSPPPPQQPPPPNIQASGGSGIHSIGGGGEAVHHQSFWSGPSPHHHNHHHNINNPVEFSNIIEGQGLSLSLSSSLQHLEAAKQAEDHLRNIGAAAGGDSHIMFFNHHQGGGGAGIGPSSSATNATSPGHHFFKNLTTPSPQGHQQSIILHNLQPVVGGFASPNSGSVGFGSVASASSSLGVVNVLRNSKYAKPAQELLEEFCSVGRGQMKKPKLGRQDSSNNQNATTSGAGGGSGDAAGSSSTKDPSQVAPADRIEHQRRKVKLLAMLDEVDRRYNHYCEQMQMVVNSFDLVVGFGAAVPYTALAQKAMSRHFRCLKDAIHSQLKQSCELLGEKDPTASSGLTKGETPRLKVLEQSLRQQRAFHQMGMMDQEAWRPQRGLPERSVNILRAWLFEHFLHPYPSDADKHLLARQTGLSRNQVSNWFINARVRLWKPMVEEMYQQEAKDEDEDEKQTSSSTSNTNTNNNFATTQHSQQHQQQPSVAQNPMPCSSASPATVSTTTMLTEGKRSADHNPMHSTLPDCDPSLHAINRHNQQYHPPPPPPAHANTSGLPQVVSSQTFLQGMDDTCHFDDDHPDNVGSTTMIRFGAATGDVSLTLGLRHAGNTPDQKSSPFSVRDFGNC